MAEHAFKTLNTTIKNNALPSVALLCGREDFLVLWAHTAIKKTLLNPATEAMDYALFTENNQRPADIEAACETLPLMSSKKLVVLDRSDIFSAQSPVDMAEDEVKQLTDYIAHVPETTMLLFLSDKPDKRKAIYKAVAKHGIVYDFGPLDEATAIGWVEKRARAAGKNAQRSDIARFLRLVDYGGRESTYTLYNMENDLKKVFASSSSDNLTFEDFKCAAPPMEDTNAFELLDAAFAGRTGVALNILHATISQEKKSLSIGVVLRFHALLCSQLEIMLTAVEMRECGQSMREIQEATGINEYRLKKAVGACKNKSSVELRDRLIRGYELEKVIKTSGMDAVLALELFIATL